MGARAQAIALPLESSRAAISTVPGLHRALLSPRGAQGQAGGEALKGDTYAIGEAVQWRIPGSQRWRSGVVESVAGAGLEARVYVREATMALEPLAKEYAASSPDLRKHGEAVA